MTRWRNAISSICGWTAAAFLTAMMLLTVADITLRTAFNRPIRGVYDLIELLLTGTFFVALPCVYLRNENILVNTIDDFAPRLVPYLKRFGDLLGAVVLGLIAWQGWIAARDSFEFHDVTPDLALPRVLHWILLLVGVIGAGIAALYMAIRGEDAK